jgi:tryptophan synthase alpha chain
MTALERLTRQLRDEGTKVLVPFLTAGYPDAATFAALTGAIARSGCRLMEIGIPFSDPVADGPVIQAASQRALEQGVTLDKVLAMAGQAHREHGLSVVLMGYLNPILRSDAAVFAAACAQQGVVGVIVPDLPPEEAGALRHLLLDQGVSLVDLAAPTTSPHRLATIAEQAAGFLYLVSVTGVTGAGISAPQDLADYLERVARHSSLPRYVGFGVNGAEQAARICRQADGVIIGSELIRIIDRAAGPDQAVADLEAFLTEVNRALGAV